MFYLFCGAGILLMMYGAFATVYPDECLPDNNLHPVHQRMVGVLMMLVGAVLYYIALAVL